MATIATVPRLEHPAACGHGSYDAAAMPCRATRLDILRAHAAAAIERLEHAAEKDRPALLIHVCAVQDELARMKHRHPIMGERNSPLAWVDDWSLRS